MYTSSCWEDQRLSTEGKIVSKDCKCKKTLGRGSVNHPAPPTLVHDWGMNLRVRPRVKWRLGHSNLGYITSYKFIPLKASCWKSIAFFFVGCVTSFAWPPVALIELLGSAPVFIKYSYKNYFQHATLLKPSQHLLSHVMVIWILFFLNLGMPLWEMRHTLDWSEWIVLALS